MSAALMHSPTVEKVETDPLDSLDSLGSLDLALRVASLATEKLAEDVLILDLREVGFTDYFVVCSGRSARQAKAIFDEVHERLKHEESRLPYSISGEMEATWIVADYLDVVLHVFTPETRAFYRLEELWSDMPVVEQERR